MARGVDVSSNNGLIDWSDFDEDFAIIRCGIGSDYESQDDAQFERNVQGCIDNGIPYGVYLYSYALNLDDVESEIAHMERLLNGSEPQLGIWYDMEDADGYKAKHGFDPYENGDILTEFCGKFCSHFNNSGVYANKDWFTNVLDYEKLSAHKIWLAHWGIDEPSLECSMWQFTSDGDVSGIDGRVDMNIFYDEIPDVETEEYDIDSIAQAVIRGEYGNGEERKRRLAELYDEVQARVNELMQDRKSIDEIAHEVIRGDWGNGRERKELLENAGYDYSEVQSRVNELLS